MHFCRRWRIEGQSLASCNITLTEAGTLAARDIPRVLSTVQNAHLAGFSVAEFEALKGYLNRILANTKNTPGDPHAV